MIIDSLTWGGAEALVAELAAAAPTCGLRMTVGYLSERDGSPMKDRLLTLGVPTEHIGVAGLKQPSALLRVRRHIARVRPDIVHTHLPYSDILGGLAARSLRVPVVSTLHVIDAPRTARERVRTAIPAAVRRRCARRVIAVSQSQRERYVRDGRDRPEHVVVVHTGTSSAPHVGDGAAVRRELGLGHDDVVVAMLTVLRAGKGHDVATAAVQRLRDRHPGLRLVVAGDGPLHAEVARLCAAIGDRAVLAGHRDDVPRLLDAVDILLHPTHADAFPTALLEAMAARVPVVATRVGGIPEIVDDGRTGVLLAWPPTVDAVVEALEPLLADVELRRRLGEAGRARFEEHFTVDRWCARLTAVYGSALSRKSP